MKCKNCDIEMKKTSTVFEEYFVFNCYKCKQKIIYDGKNYFYKDNVFLKSKKNKPAKKQSRWGRDTTGEYNDR